jgi:hypothetical protein
VRAIDATETAARRTELARALAYWAARFRVGEEAAEVVQVDELRPALVAAAADGAHHYLAQPNIFNLHGVTGAMAVELMADHISPDDGAAALGRVHAEHAAMYRGAASTESGDVSGASDDQLARAAADSRDPHQVKLVEACRRGYAATGDPTFAAAAETVTGIDR